MLFVHTSQLTNTIASDQIGCQDVSQGWLGESPLGADYQGNASVTVSGRTCQKWSLQTPHRHRVKGQGDHNYCRNPDGEPGVWCYTTDPGKRWELCPVPRCTSLPIGKMSIRSHDTVKHYFSQRTVLWARGPHGEIAQTTAAEEFKAEVGVFKIPALEEEGSVLCLQSRGNATWTPAQLVMTLRLLVN